MGSKMEKNVLKEYTRVMIFRSLSILMFWKLALRGMTWAWSKRIGRKGKLRE
jgi:hypothetical protein